MRNKLQIKFSIPESGWLEIELKNNKFKLEFETSDVPSNPIENLINSIYDSFEGKRSEVYWYLEPGCYYFILEKKEIEYSIQIDYEYENQRELICVIDGNYNEIIKPMIEEIDNFIKNEYSVENWPKTSLEQRNKLDYLLKV